MIIVRWWKRRKLDWKVCPSCHGSGACYNPEYDGTALEYCGPVCPVCKGSGRKKK